MSLNRQRLRRIINEEMTLRMREMDDMDADLGGGDDDMGFDVVPDEMPDVPSYEPVGEEIDWAEFEDDDADEVGRAFFDAIKQLREENPDQEPTAAGVVSLMQSLLSGEEEEDMDMDSDEEEVEEEDEADEGALNEWIQRTNLLAGTRRR